MYTNEPPAEESPPPPGMARNMHTSTGLAGEKHTHQRSARRGIADPAGAAKEMHSNDLPSEVAKALDSTGLAGETTTNEKGLRFCGDPFSAGSGPLRCGVRTI